MIRFFTDSDGSKQLPSDESNLILDSNLNIYSKIEFLCVSKLLENRQL